MKPVWWKWGCAGSVKFDELARIAEPTVGVITNVGNSHIELLGSRENIAKAKSELIQHIPVDGTAILNEDDEFVRQMGNLTKGKIIYYGIKVKSDYFRL